VTPARISTLVECATLERFSFRYNTWRRIQQVNATPNVLVQFGLRVAVNRNSLGKVLTQQSVRVLIAPLCQGLRGSQKYTCTSVAIEKAL
jgi:hypothetical protein